MTGHVGPLGIHAAKGFPGWARAVCSEEPFASALAKAGFSAPDQLPLGAVLGIVKLIRCVPINRSFSTELPAEGSLERAFGDYSPGRAMWLMDDIEVFDKPIPVRGMPGVWTWDLPSPDLLRTTKVA
jgi:hypothetical protein